MFCYRDYQLTTRFNQQNEKSTSKLYCLIGCHCFLFVEIALEEMMSEHYGRQWSLGRTLAGASGGSKLCFQFFVISYLCSSKIYMALKAVLFYTCSNYDRRYYKWWFRLPPREAEDYGEDRSSPTNPEATQVVVTPTGNKVSVGVGQG